ncbi:MAG TPA: class I SAM-dependent methyltransferase [Bacteroidales bacterium]|nr:class I SAM-dependent methyltransferase [Bacteroidales bacterium]HRX97693.1 class I SAM-dependent methyltransferase [Bacteroidales bacterium]
MKNKTVSNKSSGGIISAISELLQLIIIIPGAYLLKKMRMNQFNKFPISRKTLYRIGVFPIIDHYYDPLFIPDQVKHDLGTDRDLPGIDLNENQQLELLKGLNFSDELVKMPFDKTADLKYYFNNSVFLSGDSEISYGMIRHFKSRKIIEIGSGLSTLMTLNAIQKNKEEDANYNCEMICVEPFEHKWLDKLDIKLVRSMVEDVDISLFDKLEKNDILFIDSSHMIKPQGDVLFLFLHVLPKLKPGVLVHIHDIFTPRDYLADWVLVKNRMWNEQYLLEAFLSHNHDFKIISAVNFLRHHHLEALSACCPVMKKQIESGADREPGSFWIQKV